jgi:hypothetical protein
MWSICPTFVVSNQKRKIRAGKNLIEEVIRTEKLLKEKTIFENQKPMNGSNQL